MKQAVYVTYCCKEKTYISEDFEALPSDLYISPRIQKFIDFCDKHNYCWAIFSDMYGLIFSHEKLKWYDKSPDNVTLAEYTNLLNLTLQKLKDFETVYFYYRQESFHSLYKRLVEDVKTHKEVIMLTSLEAV